jgi:hypothetical protein
LLQVVTKKNLSPLFQFKSLLNNRNFELMIILQIVTREK